MPEARLSHNEIPAGLNITKRYETSHTETWDITFTATVPAGTRAPGLQETAAEIIKLRMAEILLAAGVFNPNVRTRKLARSKHRGEWDNGTEFDTGDIVEWLGKTYTATAPSCNRTPHTHTTGYRACWEEGEPFQADTLFDIDVEPQLAIEQAHEEELCPSVDCTASTVDQRPCLVCPERSTAHVEEWALQELADADIVDAEIVEEP